MPTLVLSSFEDRLHLASPEGSGDQLREKFLLVSVIRLADAVGSVPSRRAGDPGSNLGPGENFSFKINENMTYQMVIFMLLNL